MDKQEICQTSGLMVTKLVRAALEEVGMFPEDGQVKFLCAIYAAMMAGYSTWLVEQGASPDVALEICTRAADSLKEGFIKNVPEAKKSLEVFKRCSEAKETHDNNTTRH